MKKALFIIISIGISFLIGVSLASNGVVSLKTGNEKISQQEYKVKIQQKYASLIKELHEEFNRLQGTISDDLQKRRLKVSLVKLEKKVGRLEELHPYRWKDHLKNIDSEANEFRKRLKEEI